MKIGSCFCFKKFCFKFAQVSKTSFKIFKLSFGKQAISFCEVSFYGKSYFLQSQVSKIGFKVFGQVLASKRFIRQCLLFLACVLFGKVRFSKSAAFFQQKFRQVWFRLFCQVHFFWQSKLFAKSVFSKGFGKFSALAFFQVKLISETKSGL